MRVRWIVLAVGILIGLLPEVCRANDMLMFGDAVSIKAGKLVRVRASGSFVPPGAEDDPTVHGGRLHILDTAVGGAGEAILDLPADGWTRLGKPSASKGFKFRDGACRVRLTIGRLRATCRRSGLTLNPPVHDNVGVILELGAKTIRYCAQFGGLELRNTSRIVRRAGSGIPNGCPVIGQTPTPSLPLPPPPRTPTHTPTHTPTLTRTPTPVLSSGDILVVDQSAFGGPGGVIKVDPLAGTQTAISSGGFFLDPRGVAIDAAGQIIVADQNAFGGSGGLIRIDPTTGTQTTISSGGFFVDPLAVAVDSAGDLIVADAGPSLGTGSVLRVDPVSGTQTVVSTGGFFVDPHGVAIDAGGDIFVSETHIDGGTTGAIISVDPGTGLQTLISSGGSLFRSVHVTIDPAGNPVATSLAGVSAIVRVDPSTGVQTVVSFAGSLIDPTGVSTDASGDIIVADQNAFGGSGGLIRVDPTTGTQTTISSGGLFLDPAGLTVTP